MGCEMNVFPVFRLYYKLKDWGELNAPPLAHIERSGTWVRLSSYRVINWKRESWMVSYVQLGQVDGLCFDALILFSSSSGLRIVVRKSRSL